MNTESIASNEYDWIQNICSNNQITLKRNFHVTDILLKFEPVRFHEVCYFVIQTIRWPVLKSINLLFRIGHRYSEWEIQSLMSHYFIGTVIRWQFSNKFKLTFEFILQAGSWRHFSFTLFVFEFISHCYFLFVAM